MATLSIQLAANTDKGVRRTGNEDSFGVFDIPSCEAAFVVCDGMGGLQAGDLAANEAVRVIETTLRTLLATPMDPVQVLLEALRRANDAVNALARPGAPLSEDPTVGEAGAAASNAFMGTTAVAGVVRQGVLYLVHAGDSRAYRVRQGTLSRLTDDHSFVAEQVKLGNLTEAEARVSRFRNMITRAIGIDTTIQPEARTEPLLPGDLILVCTDGLTTMVEDDEIEALLQGGASLERQVQGLIDAANRKGGHDNITVLLLTPRSADQEPIRPVEKRGGGVPAPERQREREQEASESGRPARSGRRRSGRAETPGGVMLLAVIGALCFLGFLVLTFSDGLRIRLGEQLMKVKVPAAPPILDYASMTYDTVPRRVVESPLARRAPLAVLEDGTVAYVTNSEAHVVRVGALGGKLVLASDLKAPDQTKAPTESPDDEVYLAGDPQGNTYISFSRRGVIKKISSGGKELARFGNLSSPGAIAVDSRNGDLYFIDGTNHIQVFRAHPKPVQPPK